MLVSANTGSQMGGEAIKALQYFEYLNTVGYDVHLITHARCKNELLEKFDTAKLHFVEDSLIQKVFWHTPGLSSLVTVIFHMRAAVVCQQFSPARTTLHYICPISPTIPRFCPSDYDTVIGPLNGNIYYPAALRHRLPFRRRASETMHRAAQRVLGKLFKDKNRASALLVSGHERTRQSLLWAGCDPRKMYDVLDSGVAEVFLSESSIDHTATNNKFITVCRLVDFKAVDFAIEALARTPEEISLTLVGDGPLAGRLQRLARHLGVEHRIEFAGWLNQTDLIRRMKDCRAMVFPSIGEANGIAVQEAMSIGLPVIAVRWGGPAALGEDGSLILIEPTSVDDLVDGFATAMTKLAKGGEEVIAQSKAAQTKAHRQFSWEVVASSWARHYPADTHPDGNTKS